MSDSSAGPSPSVRFFTLCTAGSIKLVRCCASAQAALVVYDEIHYLRDKERGVVWEESIVLMPKTVRFAFLSATIPNALEFAQWIAKTHG